MGILNWFTKGYEENKALGKLSGVYRGFMPSSESPLIVSELEISITPQAVKSKWATGLQIQEDQIPASTFDLIPHSELAERFMDGNDSSDTLIGFRRGSLEYFFVPTGEGDHGLVIKGGLGDLLGVPTALFSPQEVLGGKFDEQMTHIEAQYGSNKVPRLKYGGRVRR